MDALANDAGVAAKAAQPAPWGGYSVYFTDPDGYLWKVVGSDAGQMAYSE